MESRKMVPKNLFTRQQWKNRHAEQIYGHAERGGEGERYEDMVHIYNEILHIQKMDQIVPFSDM